MKLTDKLGGYLSLVGAETEGQINLCEVLFKSDEDFNSFYINFFGRNSALIDDLLDYREEKLSKSKITLDKFIELCDNEVNHEIFEQVFLQKFSIMDIYHINKAINMGIISLEELFNRFKSNPQKNILRYVL